MLLVFINAMCLFFGIGITTWPAISYSIYESRHHWPPGDAQQIWPDKLNVNEIKLLLFAGPMSIVQTFFCTFFLLRFDGPGILLLAIFTVFFTALSAIFSCLLGADPFRTGTSLITDPTVLRIWACEVAHSLPRNDMEIAPSFWFMCNVQVCPIRLSIADIISRCITIYSF